MNDLKSLKPVQVDALREVANIGAGHAATAIANIPASRRSNGIPDVR